jgi:TonB-linked SusC/RagA family outer membrane protein
MIPTYNEFNIMNSQEQMSVYKEMKDKGWLDYAKLFRRSSYGVYGKLAEQMYTVDPKTGDFYIPSSWSNEYENAYLREAEYRNTDWFQELFNVNLVQNHSVSLSGGTEKSNYYASMSAMLDPGYTLQSNVKRYTMNMNLSHKIYSNLTLNLNGKGYYRNQRAPGTTKSKLDALEGRVNREFDINPYSYALNTSRTLDPNTFYRRYYSPFNIKHELENNYIDLNETSLNFIGDLTWSPIKGLELKAMGAIKYTDASRENFIGENSNQAMAFRAGAVPADDNIRSRNNFLYQDKEHPQYPHNVKESVLPVGGIYDRDQNRMNGWDFRASANYSTSLNEGTHIINLFAGTEWNSVEKASAWFRSWGIQFAKGNQGLYDYHAFKKWSEENADYYSLSSTLRREQAYFANASYSYQGRYTINGTWRYEGSNQMGKTRLARWLPTWNISGAWNVHEENFFDLVKPALSHLTLRTSYSLTAQSPPLSVSNAAIDIRSYTPWRFWQEYRESGLYIYKNANEGLTYEKKHELNVGGDFGFLDNRINLVVDWYTRNNYDLIGDITTQQGDTKGNVAAMKSQGVEFTLGTKNIKDKDFNWNTDFTFARTDVEITKLYSVNRIVDLVSGSGFGLEGYSYRMLFSLPFGGLNEDGVPMMYDGNGNLIGSTTLQLRGADNFEFLIAEGPKEPVFQGGFGNTFRYKNIRMNVFITYSGGNKLRLDPIFRSSYTDLSAMPKEFANRWMLPGDEAYTNVPAILSERQTSFGNFKSTADYLYSTYNYSTERVADGSFARLKEVSISYDFPKSLLGAVKFNNLSIKLQATNLALLYADKKLNGQDPEFMNSGGVATPIPRQFTLTINIGL